MYQRNGFATSADGTRIAYAVQGDGAGVPVVRAATIMTHVELDAGSTMWGHLWRFFADGRRFIRYDHRGCGGSERDVDDFTLEARVHDLAAVVDDLEVERFCVFGHGLSVPVAIAYAAAYPERVAGIVLLNGYARSAAEWTVDVETQVQLIRRGTGQLAFQYDRLIASTLIPDSPGSPRQEAVDLISATMTAEVAARIVEAGAASNVVDLLNHIAAPALVLHSERGEAIAADEGRLTASLMANARFVGLDSMNQVLLEPEPAWPRFTKEVGGFLNRLDTGAGLPAPEPVEGLSACESEVLRLTAQGATDRQIAGELGISVRTVGNHVASVLRKTGSQSRVQAAVWAAKRGLV